MIVYDDFCNTATCLQEDKYEGLKLRKHLWQILVKILMNALHNDV